MSLDLDNSDKRLVMGVVRLLRDNVNGWSESEEYEVDNVWPHAPPPSVNNEFPRAVIDLVSGEDVELSHDLDIKLRETVLRVTVFSDSSIDVFDLTDESENAISEHWDSIDSNGNGYLGDWTYRETDGFAETTETGETEGNLRYSRYRDFIMETVRGN